MDWLSAESRPLTASKGVKTVMQKRSLVAKIAVLFGTTLALATAAPLAAAQTPQQKFVSA